MMKVYWFKYLSVVFICLINLSTSFKHSKNVPCTQKGPCECYFPNGSGINLLAVTEHELGWVKLNETTDIYFRPCSDIKLGSNTSTNECSQGVSVCLHNNKTNTYINLGSAADAKFLSTSLYDPVSIEFRQNNRITAVKLMCSESQSQPILKASATGSNNYEIELISRQSCPLISTVSDTPPKAGLSTGSVLVLMFVVFSLVYFGGGMLTLKLLRGAEGKEMIPNYEFWADLPYLVRDGILFVVSGFQPSPSYDRI